MSQVRIRAASEERIEADITMNEAMLGPPNRTPGKSILRNFNRFSFFFAVNHGCVTAVLNLSVVILGNEGSYMSGALYVTYALTALIAAPAIVSLLGTKLALIVGTFTYCIYIISLPLALLAQTAATQTIVAIVGGAVGGVAAGFLWAAQGAYFTLSAQLYAEASAGALSVEQATSKFAASFGTVFLGCELILKLLPLALKAGELAIAPHPNATGSSPPALPPPHMPPLPPNPPPLPYQPLPPPEAAPASLHVSDLVVAVAYSIFALATASGMLLIWDLERHKREQQQQQQSGEGGPVTECSPPAAGCGEVAGANNSDTTDALPSGLPPAPRPPRKGLSLQKLAGAVTLWYTRPVVLLLAPVQITFGLCAALLGYEMSGEVVKIAFPENRLVAAGLLSALVSLVAGALQVPFKKLSEALTKGPVMFIGLLAFAALGALCLALTTDQLAHYTPLVLAYVLQGVGRACYEGTNKALYADRFPGKSEAAFANIVLANGAASAIAYFTFPELSRPARAAAALASAVLAMVAYAGAEAVHTGERRRGVV